MGRASIFSMLLAVTLGGGVGGEGQARLEVDPSQATVGDPLAATLTLDLASGVVFVPASLGSEIGPFSVEGGSWSAPPEGEPPHRWVWTGWLFAFRTGVLKVPPIALRVEGESGVFSISTEPVEDGQAAGVRISVCIERCQGCAQQ